MVDSGAKGGLRCLAVERCSAKCSVTFAKVQYFTDAPSTKHQFFEKIHLLLNEGSHSGDTHVKNSKNILLGIVASVNSRNRRSPRDRTDVRVLVTSHVGFAAARYLGTCNLEPQTGFLSYSAVLEHSKFPVLPHV